MSDTGFTGHFQALRARLDTALRNRGLETLLVYSGSPKPVFHDDYEYPYVVNPSFKALVPLSDRPHSWVIWRLDKKPQLLVYHPVDFWHAIPELPRADWTECFEIRPLAKVEDARASVESSSATAFIGETDSTIDNWILGERNPEALLAELNWHRGVKTAYEQECVAEANRIAARAHIAARDAFLAGQSEFDINLAYMAASRHSGEELPYDNIVALNENGAILHYKTLQKDAPAQMRSFLIDAGATYAGYCSDITRTYSFAQDRFADLIAAMDEAQLQMVDDTAVGKTFVDVHRGAHLKIAAILKQFGFIDMSPESALETGVSKAFFPHGLGHLIGLQVHDVAGHQASVDGGVQAPPEGMTVRTTRAIENGQILTIEPGLYFIETLLAPLRGGEHSKAIDWNRIEEFKPYGGIRIEDDIVVAEGANRNLTREAFAAL